MGYGEKFLIKIAKPRRYYLFVYYGLSKEDQSNLEKIKKLHKYFLIYETTFCLIYSKSSNMKKWQAAKILSVETETIFYFTKL